MNKKARFTALAVTVIAVGVYALLRIHKTTAPPVLYNGSVVSMGDSVAAGVGLRGDSDSSACDRTNQAYPNVLAKHETLRLLSVACSGATIAHGVTGSQTVNKAELQPQLKQLFAQPTPTLVTLTIGANDSNWSNIITGCYIGSCGSDNDTAAVDASLTMLRSNVAALLATYREHYKTTVPPLLITDYYQVFPASKTDGCSTLVGINDQELSWLRDQRTKINQTITDMALGQPGVHVVSSNFSGHELCSNDPWVQGLTAKQPYHPTAAGQQAIANAVAEAYERIKR